ncbi:MAG: AAA family ATPase [Cyanobacteriota bacterium]
MNKLTINKFRGINSLEIDDFQRINLFVGKNNSCKTSLLETIFLLAGVSNPQLLISIDNLRRLRHIKNEDFNYIFYNLNHENQLIITGEFNNGHSRNLHITPSINQNFNEKNTEVFNKDENKEMDFDTNSFTNKITGIVFNFEIKDQHKHKQNFKSSIISQNNITRIDIAKNYIETLKGSFISSNVNSSISNKLERLIISKKQKILVEILKNIDSSINDISLGISGMIYIDIGIEKLVPINILGDGIQKLLNLILTIIDTPNGIVLIDEIENGLYYSALKVLWKSVIEVSEEYNVQLFITTHNFETLKYLKEVLEMEEMLKYRDYIRSFTLRKMQDNIIKPYKYNFESFEYSLEQGIEIR